MQNCQQDSDQILPGVCKAFREAGNDSFPKFPLVFAACPLKSNMMEEVQSLRNNKITAACIGESADIDRKLAAGTTEFRLLSLIFADIWQRSCADFFGVVRRSVIIRIFQSYQS